MACALLAAFVLLLGAGAAEAQISRNFDSASVDKQVLNVYFNDVLSTRSVPASSAFTVRVTPSGGGMARTILGTGTVAISHVTATVTLASAVSEGETVTVSYAKPAANPLQHQDGQSVASFDRHRVTNNTDATKPELRWAKLNGDTLTLYYDDRLKKSAAPDRNDFRFLRGSNPNYRFTGSPSVFSNTVTLQNLRTTNPFGHGERLRFSYTPSTDATKRIQDRSGNQADAIPQWHDIENVTPPAFSSAFVNGATMLVNFNGLLDEKTIPEGSAFTVQRTRSGTTTTVDLVEPSPVAVFRTTVTLSLAEAVVSTDTVTVAYTAPGRGALRDADQDKLPVLNFTAQSVGNRSPTTATQALFSSATVNGNSLTVIFATTLSAAHTPPNSAFEVTATPPGGTARPIEGSSGSNVTINGDTVTVTLAEAVDRSEGVTVSYTKPSTDNGLRLSGGPVYLDSFERRAGEQQLARRSGAHLLQRVVCV